MDLIVVNLCTWLYGRGVPMSITGRVCVAGLAINRAGRWLFFVGR